MSHRDVKLDNLLLDQDFVIKLSDFGLAIDNASIGQQLACGTEGYMAPEVEATGYHQGFFSDIFSAGVVLFMMIKGTQPFAKATA